MTSSTSLFARLAGAVLSALTSRTPRSPEREPGRTAAHVGTAASRGDAEPTPGREPGSETLRVDPQDVHDVRIGYAPARDGAPDAGEIIWTWVPYEENDGRGKDRPVLVIGRHGPDRAYAVRMTSRPHDGDRDYLAIGSGRWDAQGRESWVDIEQLYSVHDDGMRREAAVLARDRYIVIASALTRRYGWRNGG
ncbi:type II toxin-antitoxin system PemK/MazF family toxin [Microbacterium sp. CIAB417]|uniref:type II toxin-antitoxin system PemK/MazF family toxin n=1 Tax=Microbacterium sp. CIAB417 TaxID=2860287 RepID=UPI001FACA486|nr:type II toxin-antitoxin system PemK/MazF family toxin [Microbacterium sp. CIAB417]